MSDLRVTKTTKVSHPGNLKVLACGVVVYVAHRGVLDGFGVSLQCYSFCCPGC